MGVGGRVQGVVLIPTQEMATMAGGTMEEARLCLLKECLLQSVTFALEVFPVSRNQNTHPSTQTPVKICLAPGLEWMVVCGSAGRQQVAVSSSKALLRIFSSSLLSSAVSHEEGLGRMGRMLTWKG